MRNRLNNWARRERERRKPTVQAVSDRVVQPAPFDLAEIMALIDERITEAVGRATKEVYNRQEAADYLRIGLVTLWDLTRRGLLRPNRATGKPLYLREDLDHFMRENRSLLVER